VSKRIYQFKVKKRRFMEVPYDVKAGSAKKESSGRDIAAPILESCVLLQLVGGVY